ncbi:MAG: glycosyl hydrolase 53 family protein [Candidatus Heimdallarchaeota archaeon]|nr:MAG: glycosyl hydrolase 53 family protein [Candidatus Heimdallarchaeota archaeon]
MRDYPTNTVFEGRGIFDITYFAVYANSTYVDFCISMQSIDSNPWTAPNGFSLPIFQIYIDAEYGGALSSVKNAGFRVKSSQAWDWAICIDGWNTVIFSDNDLGIPINNSDILVFLQDQTITISVPSLIIGVPDVDWTYVVVVGSTDHFSFRQIDSVASEWYGGGGEDSEIDPNCYDFLVPLGGNETEVQEYLINSYHVQYNRKAELYGIGPTVVFESAIDLIPIRGADISFLQQIEASGGKFYEDGVEKDILKILKNHGMNWIRLRLWHTPEEGYNNLEKTIEMASRIKSHGFQFLLDIHYSDSWADPGQQTKPAAWQNLTFDDLKVAVYNYTKTVLTRLKIYDVFPEMVQIGNEIVGGMLWDDGRVGGNFDNTTQWMKFTDLLKECIRGVHDSLSSNETVEIMIHPAGAGEWFFDNLLAWNISFDVIGLSYYTKWDSKNLNELKDFLVELALRYDHSICIVETAYPWTLNWYDSQHNFWGSGDLIDGYPATVQGQKMYLQDLISIVKEIPFCKGLGVCYWEPDQISVTPEFNSSRENVALFDFEGNVLESLDAFIPSDQQSSTTVTTTLPLTTIPTTTSAPPATTISTTDSFSSSLSSSSLLTTPPETTLPTTTKTAAADMLNGLVTLFVFCMLVLFLQKRGK